MSRHRAARATYALFAAITASALFAAFAQNVARAAERRAAEPTKTDLFVAGQDDYKLYRIPGIVVTRNGVVLAYCEARKSDSGDWGPIDVLLRRSTDGGKTWLPRQKIVHLEGDLPINPVAAAQKLDKPGDNTVNNPLAIVDHQTGAVHLLYCLEYMRCFWMRSDDDGASWTEPVEITRTFESFRPEYDWKVIATGPAHGIQLTRGAHVGRLVVPVWLSLGTGGHAHRPSVTSTIFSDDHGRTWRRGEVAVPDTADFVYPNETVVVQLADGRVMLNARSESKRHRRLTTTSADGASGWSTPRFDEALLEPVCMAGLVRVREPSADRPGVLAFSNPHNLRRSDVKPGVSRDRKNVSIKLSDDEGRTWSADRTLEAGFSGYSDLAALADGTILCFYERGSTDGKNIYRTGRLTVARVDEAWVRETPGRPSTKTSSAGSSSEPNSRQANGSHAKRADAKAISTDICVYGGTSGGVVAAIQAARMGKRAVLVEPGRHLGGMTSGGLSAVDIGDPRSIGGIAREYFTRLAGSYGKTLAWDQPFHGHGGPATGGAYSIEPHVAERLFDDMAAEERVTVLRDARLASVTKQDKRIVELRTEDGRTIAAQMFVDATYEGDLMAAAGVSYTVTREGNAKYGETYNGIHYADAYKPRTGHQKPGANGRVPGGQGAWDRDFPLDPYVVPGDPSSGLVPLVEAGEPGRPGDPAPGVQAYCFRLCLSTADDRLPIAPPRDYDPKRYELVVRFLDACRANGDDVDLRWFSKHDPLPNQKWDFNTATIGANLPGAQQEWPEATAARRAEIAKTIENYHRGLLHFLATDPRVPEKVRLDMRRFGLPHDEFVDNGGWPHQLYIREARRMVGELVLTEHHTFGRKIAPHSVGLGSYGTDTHEIRRIVRDGVVIREGKTATGRGGFGPYQIGYDAIVPRRSECENLFVTFALSASHTAMSSIRMEPVLMVVSQSAATAAALAIDAGVAVQDVDRQRLGERLANDGQILTANRPAAKPVVKPTTTADRPTTLDAPTYAVSTAPASAPLRILPLGDSITRGSYVAMHSDGPNRGKGIGLPHPDGGGWRKTLQDRLRAAGVAFDFVGDLDYGAFGADGRVDPQFDPDHHGLSGFSNDAILKGGKVPTPVDVLTALGVEQVTVEGVEQVLARHRPDVVLLMSGANGFDAPARDRLIRKIGETCDARLLVASILPQKAPRAGWNKVDDYNASLPKIVAAQRAAGRRVERVDMHAAVSADDLLPDGVHPSKEGMRKMADVWFAAIQKPEPPRETPVSPPPAPNASTKVNAVTNANPAARAAAFSPLAPRTAPAKLGAAFPAAAPASGQAEREPVLLARPTPADQVHGREYDVVVVGGTSGGVACAVRAAREGCSVLLVQHNRHIGGMMTNGLMQWDALYGGPRAPLFSELLRKIEDHYVATFGRDSQAHQTIRYTHEHYPIGWAEPHVAEREYNRLVAAEKSITLLVDHVPTAVERDGAIVRSATFQSYERAAGRPTSGPAAADVVVRGATFVDATYEGDLFALVRVPYRYGREARDEYKEPHAGKIFTNIDHKPADSVVGERLNLRAYTSRQGGVDPNSPFTADRAVQAYNYRFCVTSDPENRIPIAQPAGYRREEYVDYERKYIASPNGPNRKSHVNSPILPGENHDYPDGDWAAREKIIRRHLDFGLGLLWFLQNDESVPAAQREKFRAWGLPKDEYADNGHVPYEMYVREARRIVGRHVFTEHDGMKAAGIGRTPVRADSVAVTDWYMDSHSCTTDSRPGFRYDGKLILTEESRPAQIPYRSLLPQGVDNLLVPVCLSATHIAWGAVRLEPVFLQTGEAAGWAAALAKRRATPVARLDADQLVRTLAAGGQLISFFNDLKATGADPAVVAAQYFGTKGFFHDYDARLDQPLTEATAKAWSDGLAQLEAGRLDAAALALEVKRAESSDSPPSGRRRGEALLAMWNELQQRRDDARSTR